MPRRRGKTVSVNTIMSHAVQPPIDNQPAADRRDAEAEATRRWGRTWVEVDPAAIARNWRRVAARLPKRGFGIACVKKDGYGHGLATVARALADEPGVWGVGVATLEEAIALRAPEAGLSPDLRILILTPLANEALEEAVRVRATLTVTDLAEARAADRAAEKLGLGAEAHFKLDTGMGRLGRLAGEVAGEFPEILRLRRLRVGALFSHLADAWSDAHDWDSPVNHRQQRAVMKRFRGAAGPGAAALPVHWGGSDALAFADAFAPGDGIRVGIALYGDHPAAPFEPAMTFKTRVVYRRRVPAGTTISYAWIYTTTRPTELAIVGAGYGNGLPRALSGRGAEVLIAGRRCPILGRVCMDQCVVDVTDLATSGIDPRVGDEVVLFGRQQAPGGAVTYLPAAEQAARAGTIAYELFCLAGMLNPRRPAPASPLAPSPDQEGMANKR
jgi:alanine racemase